LFSIFFFNATKLIRRRIGFISKLKKACKKNGYRLQFKRSFLKSLTWAENSAVDFTVKAGRYTYYVKFATSKRFLSSFTFISKNQMTELFKESFGTTPHKYITELRLLEACELLLSTNRSLTTIANNVGYSDYSIFYKAFYAKFKISPKEYRILSDKNKSITIGKEPD
jgi:AraC-like DNA-binding protein